MPSGSFYGEFLDTVGMEYEGIGLERDWMNSYFMSYLQTNYSDICKKISITRDASTEFKASAYNFNIGEIPWISEHTKEVNIPYFMERKAGTRVMGYEIITHPLEIEELERLMYPLVNSLVYFGDFISDRAAIHYHIGYVNNLRLMQNLLKIGLYVDPVLFRLGGMGRTFRGRINNSAYARPLLHSTAAYTQSNGPDKFVKAINPVAALNAETLVQFWASFGVKYSVGNGLSKYTPCRYAGINFFAIPMHGTIEWRHTNQTHDVYMLMAIGKFLRGITELSVYITPRELASLSIVPSLEEISVSDATEILSHLYHLCGDKGFKNLPSEEEMQDILNLLENSHFQKIEKIPVLTHLTGENANIISRDLARTGKLEFLTKVLPPNHVDIHTIGLISIYDDINLKNPPVKNHVDEEESELFEEEET